MNSGAMPPEQLLAWKNQLEARLNELGQQIAPLLAEHERLRQQIDLVQKLLRLATGTTPEESVKSVHTTSGWQTQGPGDESPAGVIEAILHDAGGPLHISEICKRYLATGRMIPGQGSYSNLIAYIVRSPKFVRVSKGTYGLLPPGEEPQTRQTSRRRRRRSRSGR